MFVAEVIIPIKPPKELTPVTLLVLYALLTVKLLAFMITPINPPTLEGLPTTLPVTLTLSISPLPCA